MVFSCRAMAFVETVIEPAYFVKSAVKVLLFVVLPFCLLREKAEKSPALTGKKILGLLALGAGVYAVVFGAYYFTKGVFDYSRLVNSLSADQNVTADSFLPVALYISLCNSFVEEYLFRFTAFIRLSGHTSRKTAYLFSSLGFAAYHIAMLASSFPPILLVLAVAGLAAGGGIFCFLDERDKTIYNSWIVHMFADLRIMTIWYIHI